MVNITRCLEGNGMGGLNDVGDAMAPLVDLGGLAWVLFAAVAGFSLTAAARALLARPVVEDETDYARGWNALEPLVDR
jgi:hypothetical protein